MRLSGLLVIALFALAACATTTASGPPPIYVMRHLNTPAGERDPDLLPEGQRLAAALPGWFGRERVRAIYVSDFKRTRETAAPLAAGLGLTPLVYDPADTPGLIARVRAGPLPALIVGHSNTVPDIVAGLGGTRPAPLVHADFGDIWRVGADGTTLRSRIDGRLASNPPPEGEGDRRSRWRGISGRGLGTGADTPPPCCAWSPSPCRGGSGLSNNSVHSGMNAAVQLDSPPRLRHDPPSVLKGWTGLWVGKTSTLRS
jgi:hypothetical protein